jgi:peptidoglycan/LPS O-acetylase OafA/YrhL
VIEASKSGYYKSNNFDIIRLFAALQVVIVHLIEHFHAVSLAWFSSIIAIFPGVPIFFFISGFLISAAWERNPDIKTFALNRIYRIFPGLWICVLFSAITLIIFYDTSLISENLSTFFLWLLTQATLLQAWNPAFLRGYGIGVVNGSLWTIAVEISFYIFVPILFFFQKFPKIKMDFLLTCIIISSFALNYYCESDYSSGLISEFTKKMIFITPLPWIGMFCVGILFNRYIEFLYNFTAGRFFYILFFFILVSSIPFWYSSTIFVRLGNSIGIFNYVVLCFLIMSTAFSNRSLSDRLLRRNDISYGVYIYHQPILNLLIVLGFQDTLGVIICIIFTVIIAFASWIYVEQPALHFKKASLHLRT